MRKSIFIKKRRGKQLYERANHGILGPISKNCIYVDILSFEEGKKVCTLRGQGHAFLCM